MMINRLPRNFHKTFIPERRFIHALLKFCAGGESGDIQYISQKTGIPTGKSSGKVGPTLDYCCGMGFLTFPGKKTTVKKPILTPFGRTVLLEDPFLKSEITQWIAHLNLCREEGGADIWHQTFWYGLARLGSSFYRDDLENWLASLYNVKPGGLIGPLVSMYQEEASFARCGALSEIEKRLIRRPMPIREEFSWGFAAWILSAMERISGNGEQITIPQLETSCGWKALTGWSLSDSERVLIFVERKGVLNVDRHMQPWILRANISSNEAWRLLYSDML